MATPKTLIVTGYGINCEEETAFAFQKAGAQTRIAHVNDVIDELVTLSDYQILTFPGGFSYGDDTGSGNALANRIRNHLGDQVRAFVEQDRLVLGICNGFQVMINLGLLPALEKRYGERQAALLHNDSAQYLDRWVDLSAHGKSPWVKNLVEGSLLAVPIAHGEGKFFATPDILGQLRENQQIAFRYGAGAMCSYQGLPANPNGAVEDIAGITDPTGRILGMMPHPERAIAFTQLPHWTLLREAHRRRGEPLPTEGPGMQLFRNATAYFR